MDDPHIIPTAEPFFFPGGPIGCLLVHGFTGAPKEMRWMGEYLAQQGHSVLGIRLTGHATHPEDIVRARWQDWVNDVECGWHILNDAISGNSIPGQIFLVGLSMGGILSLLFASQRFTNRFPVAGVVCMSTPYALRPDWRLRYIEWLSFVKHDAPKGPPDWHDSTVAEDHIDYPAYPVRVIAQLRDLLAEMRSALPLVQAPVLLMHAENDTGGGSFAPDSMQQIYDHLGSRHKEMLWIKNSGHVITRDIARQQVFLAAQDFINRVRQALV